jgi:hypothetical protein
VLSTTYSSGTSTRDEAGNDHGGSYSLHETDTNSSTSYEGDTQG